MHICGKKNFTIKVLEECATQAELNTREVVWIARFNCIFPYGYNVTAGGAHRHLTVYTKRGFKQNVPKKKKFYTNRQWNAYPVLEAELKRQGIKAAQLLNFWECQFNR